MTQELQQFDGADLANLRIVKAFQTTDDGLYLKPNDAIKHQRELDRVGIIKTVLEECLSNYRYESYEDQSHWDDRGNAKLIDEILDAVSHFISDTDIKKLYSTIDEN